MFWADACVHFPGKNSYHANTMSFWCHYVDLLTFCSIFEKGYTRKYTIETRVKQKMATSDKDSAHRSAIQVCFFIRIDTFYRLKSTERYKNVSRALTYTWHGRCSDGSMDNKSRGRPKYKNRRIVNVTSDALY